MICALRLLLGTLVSVTPVACRRCFKRDLATTQILNTYDRVDETSILLGTHDAPSMLYVSYLFRTTKLDFDLVASGRIAI